MVTVLTDTLNDDLSVDNARIIVNNVFSNTIVSETATRDMNRLKTLGNAKSLLEFYDLVRQAINDYETRSRVADEYKIIFTEEEPDIKSETETITFSLVKRVPGAFGQGRPFESNVTNLRPMLRETGSDDDNPGYRYAVNGYWYDNLVRFTCWARTNKKANARAMWFEQMMAEYEWWFKAQGVNRVLFWERHSDIVTMIDNNKWYGRPYDFFVRTEALRIFSEKEMEEIIVNLSVKSQ